jgi:hypothetical protein
MSEVFSHIPDKELLLMALTVAYRFDMALDDMALDDIDDEIIRPYLDKCTDRELITLIVHLDGRKMPSSSEFKPTVWKEALNTYYTATIKIIPGVTAESAKSAIRRAIGSLLVQ